MPITLEDIQAFIYRGEVANYSALPPAASVPNAFYWVKASQGTKFIGALWGGSYYPAGTYHSDGVSWEYMDTPSQATQPIVDAGTDTERYITSKLFNDSAQLASKASLTGSETLTNKTLGSPTITVGGITVSSTELSYLDGATSNIQTQLDGKRYTIPFNSINFNPADATTYYFGGFFSVAPVTTAAVRQITVPKTGTITEVSFNSAATVVGTAGNMTISIRVNNTTDYLVTNAFDISSAAYLTVSGLSIPISANDLIEFKLLTPTWATNPTVLYFTGNILVK